MALIKKIILFVVANLLLCNVWASMDTIFSVAKKNGKLLQVDELNNMYLVDKKNGITKYNEQNDSVAYFQIANNGPIGSLDVTDPFRILVYYPNFNKICVLDRMLAIQNTIDLKLLQIHQPTAVATTKDGGFWTYDYSQNKLFKFDRQYRISAESNDLRIALNVVPRYNLLLEKENELWALSDDNYLYMFSRFGEFINKYKLETEEEIISLQRIDDQLIYATNNKIFVQKLLSQTVNTFGLAEGNGKLLSVVFTSNQIYLLSKDGVTILMNDE